MAGAASDSAAASSATEGAGSAGVSSVLAVPVTGGEVATPGSPFSESTVVGSPPCAGVGGSSATNGGCPPFVGGVPIAGKSMVSPGKMRFGSPELKVLELIT